MLKRHLGEFVISHEVMKDLLEAPTGAKILSLIFSQFFPADVSYSYPEQRLRYIGYSPLFEEVPVGCRANKYELVINVSADEQYSVTFEKIQQ